MQSDFHAVLANYTPDNTIHTCDNRELKTQKP